MKMLLMTEKRLLIAAACGLVIALLTGLVNSTPRGILGASWYGWPLAWLYVIVYPGSPRRIDWLNLAADSVLWVILSLATIVLVARVTKSNKS
jgi:hypothetical protein